MPLLFTTLMAPEGGGTSPEAPFLWTTNLLFRFSASEEVFSDSAGLVPAANNDTVARWGNQGSGSDALQSTAARRPVFRTGGLNGRPYLQCTASLQQHFEDLAFTQPSGFTTINPFTVFAVTDAVADLTLFPALLGSTVANGGKVGLYFRSTANAQIHWYKDAVRIGNVSNPQLLMAAAGRSASGATSNPYTRFWIRQNRTAIWSTESQTSNSSSLDVTATQFLRSTGNSGGGFFSGRLYEFLVYQGTLDNATTFAVEDWLAARYGIS